MSTKPRNPNVSGTLFFLTLSEISKENPALAGLIVQHKGIRIPDSFGIAFMVPGKKLSKSDTDRVQSGKIPQGRLDLLATRREFDFHKLARLTALENRFNP